MPENEKQKRFTLYYFIPVGYFFLSGCTALIYELCWIRKSSLLFGTTVFAASTVFAVFFGGLAIGSYLAGRFSRRITRPLMVYAVLEIVLGIIALCNPFLFSMSEKLYGLFYPALYHNFILLSGIRGIIITLLLLPPTIIMGTTLPLFCSHYTNSELNISLSIGLLYGINTGGAVIGALLCGFYLLPTIGITASILLSGCVNIGLGIGIVLLLYKTFPSAQVKDNPQRDSAPERIDTAGQKKMKYITAFLFFGSGFAALGYEVLWMRFLSLIIHNTVYTYTVMLAVLLTGIVIGSIIIAFFGDRIKRKALVFGSLQMLYAFFVLGVLLQRPERWQRVIDTQNLYLILLIASIIMLLPAVFSGISFPLVIRMMIDTPERTGTEVGIMSAVNTFGGIAGSLLTGFLFLTLLGLHKSILLLTGINLAIGFVAVIFLEKHLHYIGKIVLPVVCALVWVLIPRMTGTHLPRDFLGYNKNLVDFKEGLNANIAVIRQPTQLHLEINRLWQGTDKKNHQTMASHVPALLHHKPGRVLNIGIGVGQTASRFLYYDIEKLDCIDIERELFGIVRTYFPSAWMDDARVSIIIEDGRNYVTFTDKKYDLISIEIGQTFRPYLASFYTVDFYRQVKNHLNKNGIVCQFVSLACLGFDEFRSVIKTFIEIFPQSILWFNNNEFLLIGSRDTPVTLAQYRLKQIKSNSVIHKDLSVSYWGGQRFRLNRPEVFMAGFLCGPEALHRLAQQGIVYTDDRPVLEYRTAINQANPPYIDSLIPFLESPQAIAEFTLPDSMITAITGIRKNNLGNVIAAALYHHYKTIKKDIRILKEAYRYNPMHVSVNFFLGLEYSRMNVPNKALHHFNRVLYLQPDHAQTHGQLAYLYMKMGIINESEKHYTSLIEINPHDIHAYNNLGVLYLKQLRYKEAMEQFKKALALKPNYAGARKNMEYCKSKLADKNN